MYGMAFNKVKPTCSSQRNNIYVCMYGTCLVSPWW
jgi:hypothetical protein